jgi:hypothetical protein
MANATRRLSDGSYFTPIGTSMKKWADDFGGSAINSMKWQTELDTGGMAASVTLSNLVVAMGTTANAELRLLSNEVFSNPFDVMIALMMSQRIANNLVYVEAVEVDPVTLAPVAAGSDWQNRASLLLDGVTAASAKLETVGDGAAAPLSTTAACSTTAALADFLLEVRPQDVFLTSAASNTTAAKVATGNRHSTQVPDPDKLYKVRLRFKNGAVAPATGTTVTIGRIVIVDVQELAVEIASGRGDSVPGKQISVNVLTTPAHAITAGSAVIGAVVPQASAAIVSGTTAIRYQSTADINATSVKATAGKLIGGLISNTSASWRYFKLYSKAAAPVPGTDNPVLTLALAPNSMLPLDSVFGDIGHSFAAGIAFCITGAVSNSDTTVIGANEVVTNLIYA